MRMFVPATLCPVCGYDLKLASIDEIVEMCPSCGFGFTDLFKPDKKVQYREFLPGKPGEPEGRDRFHARVWRGTWMESHALVQQNCTEAGKLGPD
jgi:hypothetical protein